MNASDLIAAYIGTLAVGKSVHTSKEYRTALKQVLADVLTKSTGALTKERIAESAIRNLKGRPATTIHTYLSGLTKFLHWALLNKHIKMSSVEREMLFDAIKQMRPRFSRIPKKIDDGDVDKMVQTARETPAPTAGPATHILRAEQIRLRNIALLLALKTSGARVSELVGIKRGDVDAKEKNARVIGKGNKERIIYFDDETWMAIVAYLESRQDGKESRGIYLLPLFAAHDQSSTRKLRPLTTKSVERIVHAISKRAGIENPISPHGFRHYFATHVLDATDNIAVLQDMLGHSSPVTTRIYAKVSSKKMHDAHRAAFGGR